jgi:hypothetical protein
MRYILVKNCCRFLLLAGGSCDNLSLVLFSLCYLSVLGEKTVRCVELLVCPRQPFSSFMWWCSCWNMPDGHVILVCFVI